MERVKVEAPLVERVGGRDNVADGEPLGVLVMRGDAEGESRARSVAEGLFVSKAD